MLVDDLLHARDTAGLAPLPTATVPGFTLEAGYQVGHALHERLVARGYQLQGRKVGMTNPTLWQQLGIVAPIWGPVYDRTLHTSQGGVVTLSLAGMVAPRIETELVVCLRRDLPSGTPTPEEVAACIEWVALGFEVVNSHYAEWKFTPPDAVADFGVHAALVVGPPLAVPPDLAEKLPGLAVTQWRDGAVVAQGEGRNVLGNPLLSLAALARILTSQPWAAPLTAGEVITTGTMTAVSAISAGQRWRAEATGLPFPPLELVLT